MGVFLVGLHRGTKWQNFGFKVFHKWKVPCGAMWCISSVFASIYEMWQLAMWCILVFISQCGRDPKCHFFLRANSHGNIQYVHKSFWMVVSLWELTHVVKCNITGKRVDI